MHSSADFTVLHYAGCDVDEGGILSVVRALAGARKFGCVLGANPGFVQTRAPRLEVLALPRIAGERIGPVTILRAHRVARAARRWLRGGAPRIFHGHSRAGMLAALWLRAMGERRVVASVHCYGRQRWFYRWSARRLGARIFWLSPAMRTYYGAPGRDWDQCIPGGVAPSRVERAPPIAGRLRLGGVGSLVAWKGWHTVIEAIASLPEEMRARVTFAHIGAGEADCIDALKRLTAKRGLTAQVAFRGAEPSADRLLAGIDALVVASENEPLSIAMLEALAAGIPVLAADSGGARDVIRDGINGRLHRTGDAAVLAAQLHEWLDHPPAWDVEKIRASTIDIDRVAGQWIQVYAAL